MDRNQIVDDAIELYERFCAFALDALPDEDRHRRWITSSMAHGRELLRFAPRDGVTPPETADLITHWFSILHSWMADPEAARKDPEAISVWVSEWPAGLMRELLFAGLRSPDGLDQEAYRLQQLLPADATVKIEISPSEVNVELSAPGLEPISLRRRAGTSEGMRLPLDLALGSLSYALLARERGEADVA